MLQTSFSKSSHAYPLSICNVSPSKINSRRREQHGKRWFSRSSVFSPNSPTYVSALDITMPRKNAPSYSRVVALPFPLILNYLMSALSAFDTPDVRCEVWVTWDRMLLIYWLANPMHLMHMITQLLSDTWKAETKYEACYLKRNIMTT